MTHDDQPFDKDTFVSKIMKDQAALTESAIQALILANPGARALRISVDQDTLTTKIEVLNDTR